MDALNPDTLRVDTALQAVDAFLQIDGRPIVAVFPREVFEQRLAAEHHPEGWLKACRQHATLLMTVARQRYAQRPQPFVVVRASDVPDVAALAG